MSMPLWRACSSSCSSSEVGAVAAFGLDDGAQGVKPLAGFLASSPGILGILRQCRHGVSSCCMRRKRARRGPFASVRRPAGHPPGCMGSSSRTSGAQFQMATITFYIVKLSAVATHNAGHSSFAMPSHAPEPRPSRLPTSAHGPCAPLRRLVELVAPTCRPRARTGVATLAPLLSVLLFLAAIIAAFWYLRNEEIEREVESVKRDAELVQQQIRLRLIEQPGAARAHGARGGHPHDRPRRSSWRRPSGIERERAGDRQPDLAGRAAPGDRAPCLAGSGGGDAAPGHARRRPRRPGAAELRQHVDRGNLPRQPRAAPAGLLATLPPCQPAAGLPGAGAADRPRQLRRHAGGRILGRGAAAPLRAAGGLAAPCDLDAGRRRSGHGQHRRRRRARTRPAQPPCSPGACRSRRSTTG